MPRGFRIGYTPGDHLLIAGAGSFALSGQDATLKAARVLTAGAGSFTLTGQDATLTHDGGQGNQANWRYVRAGAAGGGDGTTWATAWNSFTSVTNASLPEGGTLWVAGGDYGGVGLSLSAASEAGRRFIKRATVASHGMSGGWLDSYDGQVLIHSNDGGSTTSTALDLNSTCRYITIDGATRTGLRGTYGIRIYNAHTCVAAGGPNFAHGITLRYCDITSLPDGLPPVSEDPIQYKGDNWIVEYCWLHDNPSNEPSQGHGDGIQSFTGNNLTVRYCVIENCGQGIFFGSPNFAGIQTGTTNIYYNLIYVRRAVMPTGGNPYQGITWFVGSSNTSSDVCNIFNNTLDIQLDNYYDVTGTYEQAFWMDRYQGNTAPVVVNFRNNAIRNSNCGGVKNGLGVNRSNNAYVNSGTNADGVCVEVPASETGGVFGSHAQMKWVDAANTTNVPNFHLQSDSPLRAAGTDVSSVAVNSSGQLVDIEGNAVSNASAPDIGAFQFV